MRNKLERLLQLLNTYAAVGDVMCQYNSDIGSLAWGGCRLVIKLALYDFEILEKIVDSLDQIFLLLGRVELYSHMFRVNRVEEGVVTLYAYILDFIQKATRFLRKRGIGRMTAAIWRPYHLEFQGTYQKIKDYVDFVDKEANAANMVALQRQNKELHSRLTEMTAAMTAALTAQTTTVEAIHSQMAAQTTTVGAIHSHVNELYFSRFSQLDMCWDKRSEECLILARKLTKYLTATNFIDNAPMVLTHSQKYLPANACGWILLDATFLKWKNGSDPNFLAILGGRNTGKFVIASFITTHLLNDPVIGKNVVWFHSVLWEVEPATPTLMLRCFIAQLLRNRPEVLMHKKKSSFYKKKCKAAKSLTDLFTLFVDMVSAVGKTYIMIDGLDSCPNSALMVDNLLQLSESGFAIKIIITAMDDPNLGPVLQDVAKITLETDSVSCDVSTYVTNQLTENFPHLQTIHPDLAMSIITGAGGSIGWARYIIWGIARSSNEEDIKKWKKVAAKGRDVVYARQFDQISKSVESRRLVLIKLVLRALLAGDNSLELREIHQSIITNNEADFSILLNSFDPSLRDERAIQEALDLLANARTAFVSCTDRIYTIADDVIRDYLFEYIPSQRPQVPHLWLPTDTCTLRCQLKHYSHRQEFENSTLDHIRADFKEFVHEPGGFRK